MTFTQVSAKNGENAVLEFVTKPELSQLLALSNGIADSLTVDKLNPIYVDPASINVLNNIIPGVWTAKFEIGESSELMICVETVAT